MKDSKCIFFVLIFIFLLSSPIVINAREIKGVEVVITSWDQEIIKFNIKNQSSAPIKYFRVTFKLNYLDKVNSTIQSINIDYTGPAKPILAGTEREYNYDYQYELQHYSPELEFTEIEIESYSFRNKSYNPMTKKVILIVLAFSLSLLATSMLQL